MGLQPSALGDDRRHRRAFTSNLLNADELDTFLTTANHIPATCVLYRRSCLQQYGYWPEDVPRAGDWRYWIRIIEGGRRANIAYAPVPGALHFNALWKTTPDQQMGQVVVARELARRAEWWPASLKIAIPNGVSEQQVFTGRIEMPGFIAELPCGSDAGGGAIGVAAFERRIARGRPTRGADRGSGSGVGAPGPRAHRTSHEAGRSLDEQSWRVTSPLRSASSLVRRGARVGLEHVSLDSFDPGLFMLGMVVSGIGFVLFVYGKKQQRWPQLVAGVLLSVFPYFVTERAADDGDFRGDWRGAVVGDSPRVLTDRISAPSCRIPSVMTATRSTPAPFAASMMRAISPYLTDGSPMTYSVLSRRVRKRVRIVTSIPAKSARRLFEQQLVVGRVLGDDLTRVGSLIRGARRPAAGWRRTPAEPRQRRQKKSRAARAGRR